MQLTWLISILALSMMLFGCSGAQTTAEDGFVEVLPTLSPTLAPSPTPAAAFTPQAEATPDYPLERMRRSGYVLGHEVNLRSGPGLTYRRIGVAQYHTKLTVTGKSGDWYRVEWKGNSGFLLAEFVGLGDIPVATPKPKPTPKPTPKKSAKPDATPKPSATPKPPVEQGSPGNYSQAEVYLVAQLCYAEARGQGTEGYQAVANVLWNRCNSSRYGGSVEEEIFRRGQFTVAKDRDAFLSITPNSTALAAAEAVFNGGTRVLPENVMYFRSASAGTSWGRRTYYATISKNCYFS